jgi:hypothetical protein
MGSPVRHPTEAAQKGDPMNKALVALLTGGLLAIVATATAAPKSYSPTGTLLMATSTPSLATSPPHRGDAVSLDATYAGLRKQDTVRVQILCFQDAGVVYGDAITIGSSPQSVRFTLGVNSVTATSVWSSGDAHCEGYLFYIANAGGGTVHHLASISFDAAG